MSNRTEATKRKPRQRATGRLPLLRLFSTPPPSSITRQLTEDHRMHIASIGIDLGKTTFHLVALDEQGTRF